jgi:CysZ protein
MAAPHDHTPFPQSPFLQGWLGLTCPLRAVGFIFRHRLWPHLLVPVLVNCVLLAALGAFGFLSLAPKIARLTGAIAGWAPGSGWASALATLVSVVIWICCMVLALALGAVLLVLLGRAIASPFLDALSERVETILSGAAAPPWGLARMVRSLAVSLGDLVGGVAILIVVQLPVFLIGLTAVGAVPAAAFGFVVSALLLAHEFVGLPLVLRHVSYTARWRVVRQNGWSALGFGTMTMVLVAVPGLNLLLLPVAVVAGTLLCHDLRRSGRLPP